MINSDLNCFTSKSIKELNKIKQKNRFIIIDNRNYKNDINRNEINPKNYFTINMDPNLKEKNSIVLSSIYQTIKNENQKELTDVNSLINSQKKVIKKRERSVKNNKVIPQFLLGYNERKIYREDDNMNFISKNQNRSQRY